MKLSTMRRGTVWRTATFVVLAFVGTVACRVENAAPPSRDAASPDSDSHAPFDTGSTTDTLIPRDGADAPGHPDDATADLFGRVDAPAVADLTASDAVPLDAAAPDAVPADLPTPRDVGPDDADTATPFDVGTDGTDGADAADTATGASPFGVIEGACADMADEIDVPAPSFFRNVFVFDGDPFAASDLDADAHTMFLLPNAGGSSKCSEVFSMEVMDDCLGADLYATETEVHYVRTGPITDYVIWVGDRRVGVSVTRAYRGPTGTVFTLADADRLLRDKLAGVNASSANVAPEDAWVKQILHVWTLRSDWADTVATAWLALPAELVADTIVLVTVEVGSDFVVTDSCDD